MRKQLNFPHSGLSCALLLAGMLTACGGGEHSEETAKTVHYSGRVTDESGVALSGIEVTLENRTTDKSITVTTEADGSFSTNIEAGAYDVLFDDPNSEKYVSLQKTAIDLQEDQNDVIQVKSVSRSPLNIISGSVIAENNLPAANRKFLIIPTVGRLSNAVSDVKNQESSIPPEIPSLTHN